MSSEACIPAYAVQARVRQLAETRNYNHKLLNIPEAWKGSKGKGITVGILDTGQPAHDDIEVAKTWSAFDDYMIDQNGHATHVAGLLAARENGHGVLGIAPEATLNTYTVLDKDGVGGAYDIAEAITQAVEDDCDILNMSLGIPAGTDISILRTACEVAADQGCILVAAAGNEAGAIDQPASYDCVIAVGAVTQTRQRAQFSNYGTQLDFVVGGVEVYSTWLEDGYAKLSGTSMACPVFAGICALIKGAHRAREEAGEDVGTPVDDVQQMIEHVKRFAFDIGPKGFDEETGHGIPVFMAPDTAQDKAKIVIHDELQAAIDKIKTVQMVLDEIEKP